MKIILSNKSSFSIFDIVIFPIDTS